MATTGKVKGINFHLYIDVSGTLTKVGNARTRSVSLSTATIDVTTADSNEFAEILPSTKSLTASVDGVFQFDTANYAADTIIDSILAGTKLTCKFGTNVVGDKITAFDAYLTSVEVSSPYDDIVTFSAELASTGEITHLTLT